MFKIHLFFILQGIRLGQSEQTVIDGMHQSHHGHVVHLQSTEQSSVKLVSTSYELIIWISLNNSYLPDCDSVNLIIKTEDNSSP